MNTPTTYDAWKAISQAAQAESIVKGKTIYIFWRSLYGWSTTETAGLGDYYAQANNGKISVNRAVAKKIGRLWER